MTDDRRDAGAAGARPMGRDRAPARTTRPSPTARCWCGTARSRRWARWEALRAQHPDAEVLGSDEVAVLPGLISAHHHVSRRVPDPAGHPGRHPGAVAAGSAAAAATRSVPGCAADRRRGCCAQGSRASSRCTAVAAPPSSATERIRQALRGCDEAGIRVAFAPGVADQNPLVNAASAAEAQAFLDALPPAARQAAEALLPGPGDMQPDEYLALMDALWTQYGRASRGSTSGSGRRGRTGSPTTSWSGSRSGRRSYAAHGHPDPRLGVVVREAVRAAHLRRVGGVPPAAAGRARAALLAGARRLDDRGRDRGAGRDWHRGEPQPELESEAAGRRLPARALVEAGVTVGAGARRARPGRRRRHLPRDAAGVVAPARPGSSGPRAVAAPGVPAGDHGRRAAAREGGQLGGWPRGTRLTWCWWTWRG